MVTKNGKVSKSTTDGINKPPRKYRTKSTKLTQQLQEMTSSKSPTPHLTYDTTSQEVIGSKINPQNIFQMSSSRGQMIKNWFDSLRHMLYRDVNFVFDSTGIRVSDINDVKNVAIISKLYGHEFELYHCPKHIAAGVNVKALYNIIRSVQPTELFSMHIERDKPLVLVISMINTVHNCKTVHRYDIIEEIEDDEVQIPDYEFPRSMTIPSHPFQKKINEMDRFEYIEIQSIRNNLVLKPYQSETLETTFTGKVRVMAPKSTTDGLTDGEPEYVPINLDSDESASDIYQGVFNVKHICEFVKKPGICDEMTFYVKNDNPLLIEYDITNLGYIRIFIMPATPYNVSEKEPHNTFNNSEI